MHPGEGGKVSQFHHGIATAASISDPGARNGRCWAPMAYAYLPLHAGRCRQEDARPCHAMPRNSWPRSSHGSVLQVHAARTRSEGRVFVGGQAPGHSDAPGRPMISTTIELTVRDHHKRDPSRACGQQIRNRRGWAGLQLRGRGVGGGSMQPLWLNPTSKAQLTPPPPKILPRLTPGPRR